MTCFSRTLKDAELVTKEELKILLPIIIKEINNQLLPVLLQALNEQLEKNITK